MLHDELFKDLVLLRSPLCLIATQFLDEKPSFVALFGVFSWDNFSDLLPIIVVEIFNELRVLNHEGEEAILEQMGFIVFPLSQRSQALRGILLLLEQFIENLHGLLIGNDSLAVELVFFVFEPDDILQVVANTLAEAFASFGCPLLALHRWLRMQLIAKEGLVLL